MFQMMGHKVEVSACMTATASTDSRCRSGVHLLIMASTSTWIGLLSVNRCTMSKECLTIRTCKHNASKMKNLTCRSLRSQGLHRSCNFTHSKQLLSIVASVLHQRGCQPAGSRGLVIDLVKLRLSGNCCFKRAR